MQPASWEYTRLEFERRFLVDRSRLDLEKLEPYSKVIEDRYFDCGRLRVRRQTDSDTGLVKFKLTKKYEPIAPHVGRIVSMWLSEGEYSDVLAMPGRELRKRRHYFVANGWKYGVDVFAGALEGLVLCEFEGEDERELFSIPAPDFTTAEVTRNIFFIGGPLCRTTSAAWREQVRTLGLKN